MPASLAGARVAAIGPGTAAALREHGVIADVVPEKFVAEGLVEALADVPVSRALIARAADARDVLPDALRERGAEVDVVALYETVAEPFDDAQRAAVARADYVTFTSSSTVRFFFEALDGAPLGAAHAAGQHRAGDQRHAARARPRARRRGRAPRHRRARRRAGGRRRAPLTRSLGATAGRRFCRIHGWMQDELRLRTRMISAGVWLSVVLLIGVGAWIAATWSHPHRGGLVAMAAAAALATAIIAALPRERIVASRLREAYFLGWSLALIVFISVAAGLDAGVRSPIVLMLFLTLVYAALSYPRWSVTVVSAASLVAVLALSELDGTRGALPTNPVYLVGLMTTLAVTGVMCICQARIQEQIRSELGRLSRSDPLTGCLNRLGFTERLAAELARAAGLAGGAGRDRLRRLQGGQRRARPLRRRRTAVLGRRGDGIGAAADRRAGAARRRRVRGAAARHRRGPRPAGRRAAAAGAVAAHLGLRRRGLQRRRRRGRRRSVPPRRRPSVRGQARPPGAVAVPRPLEDVQIA